MIRFFTRPSSMVEIGAILTIAVAIGFSSGVAIAARAMPGPRTEPAMPHWPAFLRYHVALVVTPAERYIL